MKKILIFAGTRPEIIKMAPLVREFKQREQLKGRWQVLFCFTGQHMDMATPLFQHFEVQPDHQLELMNPGQSLGSLTSLAFKQLDQFIFAHKEALCTIVQGDTTTAFAAAMTSFYHHIPVAHVEAGLRTQNKLEPFPEEINRRLITQIASCHFAPTSGARDSLLAEKVDPDTIQVTGNTGIDALLWTVEKLVEKTMTHELSGLRQKRLVMVTLHRRENLDEKLLGILSALKTVATQNPDVQLVFPVHPNPKVSKAAKEALSGLPNIKLLGPLPYPDLVWLMRNSEVILTDSGGIQEEAPSLEKPVVVLRNETERPEAVKFGTSLVVGTRAENIILATNELLSGKRKIVVDGKDNPFGDGKASQRIVDFLTEHL